MKYALYFLGTKIKESNSREYLITELYSMGIPVTLSSIDIMSEDWEVVEND